MQIPQATYPGEVAELRVAEIELHGAVVKSDGWEEGDIVWRDAAVAKRRGEVSGESVGVTEGVTVLGPLEGTLGEV